jgi:hypothetical protein
MKLLIILLCLCGSAQAQWRDEDTVRQVAITALLFVDYKQSSITTSCTEKCWELNPLLGDHPSPVRLRNYFLTMAVSSAILAYELPPKWRTRFQYGTLTLESVVVLRNQQLGFKFRF